MNEQEQRELARRIADGSRVLDFAAALQIVQHDPAGAEKMLRDREERKRLLKELACANERLHQAALEFR
ncbi:MAG: hypothetical protein M3335_08765 [Actinomycetota bacterium]|nr:hypothetical protein [Actinomycetota bacterium]